MYKKRFSNRLKSGGVFLIAILIFFAGGCKKSNGGGESEQTLKMFFSSSPKYTLFNRALQKTHLDSLLGGTNPYTVFASDDSAMSLAGYTAAGIDTADIGNLTRTLLYQLVPGAIASTDVELYRETILTTADSGYQAFLEYNNFGVFYNGIPLVNADNRFANGMVQGIRSLAKPPIGDLISTIAKMPELSDFSFVITQAVNVINVNASYNNIIPYVSSSPVAPITLFVPDNNYFASKGLDSYAAILQHGGGAQPYMTQGLFFTSDFIGSNAINEYNGTIETGAQLWFSQDGGSFFENQVFLRNVTVGGHYRLVQSNIVATDAVIHVIEPY